MPLSDEEARLLEQLERSLSAEDPEFASALRGSKIAGHYRRVAAISALGCVIGIALLLVGAMNSMTWLGALGFLGMVAGCYGLLQPWRMGVLPGQSESVPKAPRPKRENFMQRMEQRWQDRKDQGPY